MQNPNILRNYDMLSTALDSQGEQHMTQVKLTYSLRETEHTRKAREFKENKTQTDKFESDSFRLVRNKYAA